ncbi:MAG: hypothetical protein ACC656_09960, partial [Candidatus Heimdallarchaeota archaeon]
RKLVSTLDNYLITGIHTTVPFIKNLLSEKEFSELNYHTRYLEDYKRAIPENILNLARIAAISTIKSKDGSIAKDGKLTSLWRQSVWNYR